MSDKIKRILKIIGICISLLITILSGSQMIKTWFSIPDCIAFLTSLAAFVALLAGTTRPKVSGRSASFLLMAGFILLLVSIALFVHIYCQSKVLIKITEPVLNEQIHDSAMVSGYYQNIPLDQEIWVLVQDKADGTFYLGDAINATKNGGRSGDWYAFNIPVGSYADDGKEFDIWGIVIKQNGPAKDTILKYKNNFNVLQPKSLPPNFPNDKVNVIRKTY